MSDFVLTCESAADRTREFFASRNIPVVCFHYEIDDVVYTDDLYQSIAPNEFFAQIAAGAMPKTSQLSVGEYEEFWEPFVAEGKDVLHLTLSSGISGTYGSACVAAQMLAGAPFKKAVGHQAVFAGGVFGLWPVAGICRRRAR